MSEIRGEKVLIVGFGREGRSALAFIRNNYPGVEIAVADKNPEVIKYVHHRVYSGEDYLEEIGEYDTVVKSPGVPESSVKKAKYITTLTNIFFENCRGTVVGVTGTKGKSTTSTLIAHILTTGKTKIIRRRKRVPDVRLIGNVGKPALDYLEKASEKTVFVMELSSYQLSDIHYSPQVAVILPIYPEHLDYHGSFEKYVSAKANITKFQKKDDSLFYFEEDKHSQKIARGSKATRISYRKFVGDTPLLGEANKINVGAAIAIGTHFAVEGKKILAAIASFKPLPHRLEKIGEFKGISFVNDSLATIPEATMHALEALGENVETLIAGGFDRGIDFSELGENLAKSSVRTLILFPTTGEKIERALKRADKNTSIKIFKTDKMEEAVKLAYEHTPEGAICLMSPASTSFNMFKNYEERGNAFRQAVEKLGK